MHRSVILASDCPFSHEILDDYENAYFFDPFNGEALSNLMRLWIDMKTEYININRNHLKRIEPGRANNLIDKII